MLRGGSQMNDLTHIILNDILNRLVLLTQNQKKIMDKLEIEDKEKEQEED